MILTTAGCYFDLLGMENNNSSHATPISAWNRTVVYFLFKKKDVGVAIPTHPCFLQYATALSTMLVEVSFLSVFNFLL